MKKNSEVYIYKIQRIWERVLVVVCVLGVLLGLLCQRTLAPGASWGRGFPCTWLRIVKHPSLAVAHVSVFWQMIVVDAFFWLGVGTLLILLALRTEHISAKP